MYMYDNIWPVIHFLVEWIVMYLHEFGFYYCLLFTFLGSGIFISPKGIAEGSGSVGFALTNWALCGFFSLLGKTNIS